MRKDLVHQEIEVLKKQYQYLKKNNSDDVFAQGELNLKKKNLLDRIQILQKYIIDNFISVPSRSLN